MYHNRFSSQIWFLEAAPAKQYDPNNYFKVKFDSSVKLPEYFSVIVCSSLKPKNVLSFQKFATFD